MTTNTLLGIIIFALYCIWSELHEISKGVWRK